MPITMVTAMVSPNALPRPSSDAPTMPDRARGSTAMRIISHRVAPRASAASFSFRGVLRKTSRHTAAMIGRTMIASTSPALKYDTPKNGPWNATPITGTARAAGHRHCLNVLPVVFTAYYTVHYHEPLVGRNSKSIEDGFGKLIFSSCVPSSFMRYK